MTRRSERALGLARAKQLREAAPPGPRLGAPAGTPAPGTGAAAGTAPAADDVYLLSADRCTGQPPPPAGAPEPEGLPRAERPGRMAIGLSGV
ncbi:MAG: hypothetical protein ACRDZX_16765 [Acidimicrobiales bacterium]